MRVEQEVGEISSWYMCNGYEVRMTMSERLGRNANGVQVDK